MTTAIESAQLVEVCIELLRSLHADAEREFANFSEDIVSASQRVSELEKNETAELGADVSSYISSLLMRMQFSDRFCQRVDNVQRSLECLRESMNNGSVDNTDETTMELLVRVRGLFTTEQERALFDQKFDINGGSSMPVQSPAAKEEHVLFFDD